MQRAGRSAVVTKPVIVLLGWFAGLAWLLMLPALPDATQRQWVLIGCALGMIVCLGAMRFRRMHHLRSLGIDACIVCTLGVTTTLASFAWTSGRLQRHMDDRIPPAFEGREVTLTGCVATLPAVSAGGVRFVVDVTRVHPMDPGSTPRRVSLAWTRDFGDDDATVGPSPRVAAGECWQWPVRLKRPHGAMNPHARDGELWALEADVGAVGQVVTRAGLSVDRAPRRLSQPRGHHVLRWRQATRDAIERHVPDARTAGVLAALTIGDQAAIDRVDWDLFRQTGVAHLVAISGLHVTLFATLAAWGIRALWRRSPRACLWWPAPRAGLVLGVALSAAYAVFAGWGVPAQRTVWMLAIVAAVKLGGWRWPWPCVMALAAGVVTLVHPWAVLQPGFWLSFAAVAMLIASAAEPLAFGEAQASVTQEPSPRRLRPGRWAAKLRAHLQTHLHVHAKAHVHAQVVATLGLAPLGVLFFQQVSWVGFVANLLAIPMVTLVITPLALLGVVLPPLWGLGAWATQALAAALEPLARLPSAWWYVAAAPPWVQALGILGGVLAVLPLPGRWRVAALALLVPLYLPVVQRPQTGHFEAVALDVGQGTSVLVRTRQHLLVYDTGSAWPGERNAGERHLLPLLHARGERRIDRLVLSHRDIDHVGGAHAILQAMPVSSMWTSLEATHPLLSMGVPNERCLAGQTWVWDGVRFEGLHPLPQDYLGFVRTPNAVSCVLRVTDAQGRSLLLSGDVSSVQEWAMVQRHPELESDALVVAHHGSRSSTSDAWLRAVAPRDAIIQAGYRNRFGHPHPDVESRLAEHGVRVHRSDRCGAWTRLPSGDGVCERERRRRVWHDDLGYRRAWLSPPP